VKWIRQQHCPVCGDHGNPERVRFLPGAAYRFGTERIPYPEGGVPLGACPRCGLVFKQVLPAPSSLAELFQHHAGEVWQGRYSFNDESQLLTTLLGDDFDLLDVGPSNGAWLGRCPGTGRRSGLDVIAHPGVTEAVRGEFVLGFLDQEDLQWEGRPYDVATAFDVFEHLYAPRRAFANLRMLLKPRGHIIIETGDVCSRWPIRLGAERWWYARVLEHHVFWSETSLRAAAETAGFQVISCRRKRHKGRAETAVASILRESLLSIAYWASPEAYETAAHLIGRRGLPPGNPWAKDHLRAILRLRD